MSKPCAVELDRVTAGYGDRMVLRDVSCRLDAGSFTGIIGPNGAGKTTWLRVVSGSLPAQSGDVRWGDRPMTGYSIRERAQHLAFVPQTLDAPVSFTVWEFVAMGRTPYVAAWKRLSGDDRRAVDRAIGQMDVGHVAERPYDALSGGEQQRVRAAMALAQEPEILLLDEPTAHLDIKHVWRFMELIHDLNRSHGLTIVLTSHDLNIASEFCDDLILLNQGVIEARGAPGDVIESELLSRVYDHPISVTRPAADHPPLIRPRRR